MIAPGNQTLDLLLGNVPTGAQPATPGQAEAAGTAGFGDILSTLLSLGGQPIADDSAGCFILGSGEASNANITSLLSSSGEVSDATPAESVTADGIAMLSGLTEAPGDATEPGDQVLSLMGAKSSGSTPLASAETVLAALPAQGPISNQCLRNIISNVTIGLQPGLYQITSASVADGMLNLTLTDSNGSAEPINVTLPAEPMQQAIGRVVRNPLLPQRVELGTGTTDTMRLETLLSNLHLKELVVERSAPTNIPAQDAGTATLPDKTAITITAEHAGAEIAIRTKLSRSSMKVLGSGEETPDDAAEVAPQYESETGSPAVRVRSAKGAEALNAARVVLTKSAQGATTNEQTLSNLGKQLVEGDKSAVSTQVVHHNTESVVGSEMTEARPVRISLPDNVASALKPNGRSVMLRIEPQQLGPARLTLVMNNDTLSARLVVENVAAKVAVERHLDSLVDGLAKANIEVGSIEVEVSGGGAQDGYLDRQTFWSSARTFPARFLAELDGDSEKTAATNAVYAAPAMYAGAGGVNILA